MILVQRTFGDGTPPEELAWATMILILKGKGEFWGIGLVEVAWKFCATVVNCPLRRGVVLHDALHGFRGGAGNGDGHTGCQVGLTACGTYTRDPFSSIFVHPQGI